MNNIKNFIVEKELIKNNHNRILNISNGILNSVMSVFPINTLVNIDDLNIQLSILLCNHVIRSNKAHSFFIMSDLSFPDKKNINFADLEQIFILQPYTFTNNILSGDNAADIDKFSNDLKYRLKCIEDKILELSKVTIEDLIQNYLY